MVQHGRLAGKWGKYAHLDLNQEAKYKMFYANAI